MYRYIYGPVPSRRLGLSLGIDLIPHKVCSFNCVYCECGRTTVFTAERKEYYPAEEILNEVRDFLRNNPLPDWLTFSGSGEPTLNSEIGKVIRLIKSEFPQAKIAVLTNSSLLYLKDVRDDLLPADLIVPSLDSATEDGFKRINRPIKSIQLNMVIQGIIDLRNEIKAVNKNKQIWLEIFVIEGINTTRLEIEALRQAIERIQPDKVQLNSLDRPGVENWLHSVPLAVLQRIQQELSRDTNSEIEIIQKYSRPKVMPSFMEDKKDLILETISRRPSTMEDLFQITGLHPSEINKYIDILNQEQKIDTSIGARGIFYHSKK